MQNFGQITLVSTRGESIGLDGFISEVRRQSPEIVIALEEGSAAICGGLAVKLLSRTESSHFLKDVDIVVYDQRLFSALKKIRATDLSPSRIALFSMDTNLPFSLDFFLSEQKTTTLPLCIGNTQIHFVALEEILAHSLIDYLSGFTASHVRWRRLILNLTHELLSTGRMKTFPDLLVTRALEGADSGSTLHFQFGTERKSLFLEIAWRLFPIVPENIVALFTGSSAVSEVQAFKNAR